MKIWGIVVVGLLAAGCGSDKAKDALGSLTGDGGLLSGGADAGPVAVNVDSDAGTIGDIPAPDKTAICDTMANSVNDGVSLSDKCDLAGILASATAAKDGLDAVRSRCQTAVDTCRTGAATGGAAAESAVPKIALKGCALFKGDTATCDKPITLLETCLTDMAKAAAVTVASFACETLTIDGALAGVDDLGSAVPDTPACAELGAACPGIFHAGAAPVADAATTADAGDAGTPATDATAAPATDAAH